MRSCGPAASRGTPHCGAFAWENRAARKACGCLPCLGLETKGHDGFMVAGQRFFCLVAATSPRPRRHPHLRRRRSFPNATPGPWPRRCNSGGQAVSRFQWPSPKCRVRGPKSLGPWRRDRESGPRGVAAARPCRFGPCGQVAAVRRAVVEDDEPGAGQIEDRCRNGPIRFSSKRGWRAGRSFIVYRNHVVLGNGPGTRTRAHAPARWK